MVFNITWLKAEIKKEAKKMERAERDYNRSKNIIFYVVSIRADERIKVYKEIIVALEEIRKKKMADKGENK